MSTESSIVTNKYSNNVSSNACNILHFRIILTGNFNATVISQSKNNSFIFIDDEV